MRVRFSGLLVKVKLFLPTFVGIIVALAILSLVIIRLSNHEIHEMISHNLQLEVRTLSRMFDRERILKTEKVANELKVLHALFYSKPLKISPVTVSRTVVNQNTHQVQTSNLKLWYLNGTPLNENPVFVDSIASLTGGTITVFQRIDSGFVRIATNVKDSRGQRAIHTFIPNSSPVAKEILQGHHYFGRAFVVNDWYVTAYEPLNKDGKLVGMLYAGDKEKDLNQLREILNNLQIGRTGYAFVFDEQGTLLIHPGLQESKVPEELFKKISGKASGLIDFRFGKNEPEEYIAFEYFPGFKLYVCASVVVKDESSLLIRGIFRNALIIALVSILLFSVFVYFLTTKNVHRYLVQIERADKQLVSAREALERSEEQFRTFFNSSSDEIYIIDFEGFIKEVNDLACENLNYKREELIGKHFRELKSERYSGEVQRNIDMIRHFGQFRYETENITRDGKIIPLEMKSRVIEYNREKRILSIARDITERKEIEEKILKAIISTEENERKRFAADLHDDLGPILSSIKLYTDLLKKGDHKKTNREETVASIDELVDLAIRTSREISNRIRSNVLQDFGLADAITEFCSYITQAGTLSIDLRTENYSIHRRGIEESILFQVVKELVNNTIKHSKAGHVLIDLKSIDNQIILYYRDDGTGFDLQTALKSKSGLGLYNILNKVKTINGTCDLNSSPGKGMFMTISVKLKTE
jgi:PAS domain S-box-containing protein